MIWGSFFAGATAMLFAIVILLWLIPHRDKKENAIFREEQRSDMGILQSFWQRANETALERNIILNEILSVLNKGR